MALLVAASFAPLSGPNLAGATVDPVLSAWAGHDGDESTLGAEAGARDEAAGAAVDVHRHGDAWDAGASARAAGRESSVHVESGPGEPGASKPREPRRNASMQLEWFVSIEPEHQRAFAGEAARFDVRVHNPGNDSLSVTLSVAKSTPGWSVALNESTLTIPPRSVAGTSAFFASPRNASAGDDGAFTLAARALDESRFASARLSVVAPRPHGGAEARLAPGAQEAEPGDVVNYSFSLRHSGNTVEEYALSASARGLGVRIVPESVRLAPGESASARVHVFVPANASAPASHEISAFADAASTWGVNAAAHAPLHVVAPPSPEPEYGVNLTFHPAKRGVRAGESAPFDLTVRNTGSVTESIDVRLGALPHGWSASVGSWSLTLAAGAKHTLPVKVFAPYDANVGDAARLITTARVREAPASDPAGASAGAVAHVTAGPWFAVNVSARSVSAEAHPGEWLGFEATVTNTGDRATTFALASWNDHGLRDNLSLESVHLASGESARVLFGAFVPEDAPPGNVTFGFRAESRDDPRALGTLTTRGMVLPAPYDYGVTGGFTNGDRRYAQPGESTTFTLRLDNGDGTHAFRLQAEDLPAGWSFSADGGTGASNASTASFVLAPGESRDFALEVTVARCEDLREYAFDVVAYASRQTAPGALAPFEEVLRVPARVQVVHPAGLAGAAMACAP